MKAKTGSRVFYDTYVSVNEHMQRNKWQAEIGDISENEWKLYFLYTKKCMKLNFEDSNIR